MDSVTRDLITAELENVKSWHDTSFLAEKDWTEAKAESILIKRCVIQNSPVSSGHTEADHFGIRRHVVFSKYS